MTPEQKLSALLSAAARPEPQGFAFSALLAQRIARRRALYRLLALVPLAAAAASVLWTLDSVLKHQTVETGTFEPLAPGLLALVLALATAFGGRLLARVIARR
ncbi:hypothetical protein P7B02_12605 [Caulobacter segnis]|uniref:hypothetical protein n=1 Tax=Caulobacter segnis TaxID=88688 RepID=UPI00240F0376|nr:hypothetical protein [Caulobacter segnis]MDG2522386.1 hypothetical protein [Caulobacter segnis]